MASGWGSGWGSAWGNAWGSVSGADAIVQPVLPILTPGFRSIDAKSIADAYNRNSPDVADYKFPNGRRFYQS